jgi:hypothetical protein
MLWLSRGVLGIFLLAGTAVPGLAQQNLEAGKSAGQIFSSTCSACHKTSRGLLKTVAPTSLRSFLRQHYTTSTGMADMLAAYVAGSGGADARIEETPPGRKPRREDAAPRPDAPSEPSATPTTAQAGQTPAENGRKTKGAKGKKRPEAGDVAAGTPASGAVAARTEAAKPQETPAASDGASRTTAADASSAPRPESVREGAFVIPVVPLPPPVTSSKITISSAPQRDTKAQ